MLYEIDTSNPKINWQSKGTERILQNVINLINTKRYEVSYARTMGISRGYLDSSPAQMNAILTADIIDSINTYEPRATVKEVKLVEINNDGSIKVRVVIDI